MEWSGNRSVADGKLVGTAVDLVRGHSCTDAALYQIEGLQNQTARFSNSFNIAKLFEPDTEALEVQSL
jgi:hypothetical protein